MASLESNAGDLILIGDGWLESDTSLNAVCESGGDPSGLVYFTDFDFSDIPDTATIDGVEVSFIGLALVGVNELDVRLLDGGQPAGSNDAGAEWESAIWKEFVRGAPNYKWGLSLTPAHVKSPTFGVALNVESAAPSGPPAVARVRDVSMRVYYH